eukprot:11188716-Lingulodinium_polyedra.AAC.1
MQGHGISMRGQRRLDLRPAETGGPRSGPARVAAGAERQVFGRVGQRRLPGGLLPHVRQVRPGRAFHSENASQR